MRGHEPIVSTKKAHQRAYFTKKKGRPRKGVKNTEDPEGALKISPCKVCDPAGTLQHEESELPLTDGCKPRASKCGRAPGVNHNAQNTTKRRASFIKVLASKRKMSLSKLSQTGRVPTGSGHTRDIETACLPALTQPNQSWTTIQLASKRPVPGGKHRQNRAVR